MCGGDVGPLKFVGAVWVGGGAIGCIGGMVGGVV